MQHSPAAAQAFTAAAVVSALKLLNCTSVVQYSAFEHWLQ
jgi:hypothetical protein